jgi:hypothetical protein
MQVRILDDDLEVLWVKTETGGVTSTSHRQDGTLERIITSLECALLCARAELVEPVSSDDPATSNSRALELFLSERQRLVEVADH